MARPTPPKRVLQIIAALRLLFAIAIEYKFNCVGRFVDVDKLS